MLPQHMLTQGSSKHGALLLDIGRYLQKAVCGRCERRTAPRTAAGEELAVRQLRRPHPPRLQQIDVLRAGTRVKSKGWAQSLLWSRTSGALYKILLHHSHQSHTMRSAAMQGCKDQPGEPVRLQSCMLYKHFYAALCAHREVLTNAMCTVAPAQTAPGPS